MKKFFIILIAALMLCFLFASCDSQGQSGTPSGGNSTPDNGVQNPTGDNNPPELKEITGITFSDAAVTFDGAEHKLEIKGALPENASVTYTNNAGTNAGTYNASASITADGYSPLTLSATLTINKAVFSGISFSDKQFFATGGDKEILISHENPLPAGTTVAYQSNKASEVGVYNAVATISNPNYETLVLNATMRINGIADISMDIIGLLISHPDAWEFLPESFAPENMAVSTPIPADRYANGFVYVNDIPKKVIGKQMNVVYTTLNNSQAVIRYADVLFDAAGGVASLYQSYIADNPEKASEFSSQIAGFSFTLTIEDDESFLVATNGSVTITLSYDNEYGMRKGHVRLTDGTALRYESTENSLRLAYKAMLNNVGYLTELSFARNEDNTVGYLHEYIGGKENGIKTSALIKIDDDYTRIISDKRESDDLSIQGYQEVYDTVSGEMVGARVAETVKLVDYDTLWFNLYDVSGIKNVMLTNTHNGLNPHTVYVNNESTAFETKKVITSRRYDVEMKDVYYVIAETDGEDVKYKIVCASVPMLFVQTEYFDTLGADIKDENPDTFTTAPIIQASVYESTSSMFDTMLDAFTLVKQNNSYDAINGYIEND